MEALTKECRNKVTHRNVMKRMPITLRCLRADEKVPENLPLELRTRQIMLSAYQVQRGNEHFLVGFVCGQVVDGNIKISPTGEAVIKRLAAFDRKNANVYVVELRHEETAWKKTQHHLFEECHDGHVVVFLAANDQIYDEAKLPIYGDPAIMLFDPDGCLLPKLNEDKSYAQPSSKQSR